MSIIETNYLPGEFLTVSPPARPVGCQGDHLSDLCFKNDCWHREQAWGQADKFP